jgi:hypothetical protein
VSAQVNTHRYTHTYTEREREREREREKEKERERAYLLSNSVSLIKWLILNYPAMCQPIGLSWKHWIK